MSGQEVTVAKQLALVIDLNVCVGCHACVTSCKQWNTSGAAGPLTDIDAYGATNPPEFFAVITEMFFEKPRALQRRHPELYAELAGFYRQDPAAAR